MKPSANVVAELTGREKPEEVVLIGGHLDSWDVGQGAHDDGAGVVIAMEALNLLRRMNLTPRRTIRAVLFTNEEAGGEHHTQADTLDKVDKDELQQGVAVMAVLAYTLADMPLDLR